MDRKRVIEIIRNPLSVPASEFHEALVNAGYFLEEDEKINELLEKYKDVIRQSD